MKKLLLSLAAAVISSSFAFAQTTFTKVTSLEQLADGGRYVILSAPKKLSSIQYGVFAMATPKSNNKGFDTFEVEADVTEMQDSYSINEENVSVLTLKTASTGGEWCFMNGEKYVDGSTNKALKLADTESVVNITLDDASYAAKIVYPSNSSIQAVHANGTGGVKGTVTINCYTTSQNPIFLYVDESSLNPGDTKKPAGLAWSASTVDVEVESIGDFEAPTLTNPNNLTVTYSSSNETVGTVNETTGVVKLEGEEGTTVITASFAGNDEFRAQDVSYTINVKSTPTVASVKGTTALADKTEFKVGYALTVGFIYNAQIYAVDAAGDFIQIYKSNTGLNVGDVIPAGWTGKYVLYSGTTPEIEPVGSLPAATEGSFTAAVVQALDVTTALVNHVITVKDVVLAEATPGSDITDNDAKNFTGMVGDVELNLRNHYKLESVEAGTYDITMVVNIYNDMPSLYVIKFEKSSSSGIDEIEAADNAGAVYYNLQGVRVDNPENGLYIRVSGNKVTKVLVK